MTRYGFVLDQTKCIGCHACTVACKSENDVPVGSFRTWVKYIEKGEFPNVSRYFSVMRCNQCDDAPCVEICPTVALFRRPDGIVDFDNSNCIGCKSCMQACPYDALYINPANNTAAKCHFCAHRTDLGLQPACAVVCPTQAIVPGDFDDPTSLVSQIIRTQQVSVRKPEQGTKPKVYYVGADAASLTPSIERTRGDYSFAQRPETHEPPGDGSLIREIYDVSHITPWGWKVWTYLWTKSIAAGAILVAAVLGMVGTHHRELFGLVAPILGLVFITITALLLIFDLKRPDRFYFLLLRPNWRSWLVWGGYILGAFGALCALWLAGSLFEWNLSWLAWTAIPLSAFAAGYTAFLFWQCEGRDFWQSPILLPDLLAQAATAGAASLLLLSWSAEPALRASLLWTLALGIVAHLICAASEIGAERGNLDLRRASRWMLSQPATWWGAVGLGIVVPLILFGVMFAAESSYALSAIAGASALAGLFQFEKMWIKAGQSVPLS